MKLEDVGTWVRSSSSTHGARGHAVAALDRQTGSLGASGRSANNNARDLYQFAHARRL